MYTKNLFLFAVTQMRKNKPSIHGILRKVPRLVFPFAAHLHVPEPAVPGDVADVPVLGVRRPEKDALARMGSHPFPERGPVLVIPARYESLDFLQIRLPHAGHLTDLMDPVPLQLLRRRLVVHIGKRQAVGEPLGVQRKLEEEMDKLDCLDRHYDRKYESLSRRLDDAFDAIEAAERNIADCEARLESIRKEDHSQKSVYESLRIFNELFDKMDDREKKIFVRGFIESIELNPGKHIKGSCPIKTIHFKIPVSYNGESVYSLSPKNSSVEKLNPEKNLTEICYPEK